jgi:oxalate decarboxylase/phosphoglucose isomerase-like protein (cupin superfamily)
MRRSAVFFSSRTGAHRHRGADQWLFVLSGQGEAHQVRNTGRTLLRTLNFYVPPAYRQDGDPLPRGRK